MERAATARPARSFPGDPEFTGWVFWIATRNSHHSPQPARVSCHTTVNKSSYNEFPYFGAADKQSRNFPRKYKMGRQPRSGDTSLAIGPFDPDWDRR